MPKYLLPVIGVICTLVASAIIGLVIMYGNQSAILVEIENLKESNSNQWQIINKIRESN